MKSLYLIQPYHVGSRNATSLAAVIPTQIVQAFKIDDSTIFAVRADVSTKTITLTAVNMMSLIQKGVKPAGEGFEAINQQTSTGVQ